MRRRQVLTGAAALAALPAAGLAETPAPAPTAAPTPGVVKVELTTGQGVMSVELFADKAPISVANFLRYLDAKGFDGASFFRAATAPGAPQIGLIQGHAKPGKLFAPVAHESTILTGLRHKDGTLSLARRAQGTAQSDFFVCVGDAPYLDADPKAEGDNAGFAAFGHVTAGMDVARKILAMPRSATLGGEEMKGQMLDPPVPIISAKRV